MGENRSGDWIVTSINIRCACTTCGKVSWWRMSPEKRDMPQLEPPVDCKDHIQGGGRIDQLLPDYSAGSIYLLPWSCTLCARLIDERDGKRDLLL
mmetsp:Transcript_1663/g.10214  ORF Transcript_1663/g.10214 Transcript_1663/m.10214 type:complete len:95 (-) Transcript_1663:1608-1892(-)